MSREKLWVVRAGDGTTLLAILKRAGEDLSAIDEGRVFVGKHRAAKDQLVKVGDAISIGGRVESPRIEVLFERDGVIACIKPAGLPTVPDHAGSAHSLVALVEKQTKNRGLRVTSRLDREVSGVVLFAIDEAAETRLRDARAAGVYARRYVAIAIGEAQVGATGTWDATIGRTKDPLLRGVGGPDAKDARTRYRVVAAAGSAVAEQHTRGTGGTRVEPAPLTSERGRARVEPGTLQHERDCIGALLLAVDPETGRTHQIRVHSAHAGWPLLGDRDYGPGKLTLTSGAIVASGRIALHCARVEVGELRAEAPIPPELVKVWDQCGGLAGDWANATA